ncbi:transcriptional regulator [Rivularia sp. PCC 7116]|uniref:TetR/AcrR family transcriptional regulator n=1 Tax=Rivularia sp. PCC 7116 TaxID=373994 RepID=UPI00029F0396|nr:TetR/AcrR family transcriptional regulator [Rivularia sp. PCC 7116]AFY57464.1 transcriptional regulator [Rivularia sp. PCC 7116]
MSGETNEQRQQNRLKSSDLFRKHQLREKILIAAANLFYYKGFNQVSINEVIVNSDVARRTFYRYFSSKDELIVQVMRFQSKRWLGWFEEALNQRASDPKEKILISFDVWREWFESPDFRGCPFIKSALEIADISHPVNQIAVMARQSVRTYIFKLALEADIPKPEVFSQQYLLLLGGSILMASIEDTSIGVEYARETLTAFMNKDLN